MDDEFEEKQIRQNNIYQNNKVLIWLLILIIAFIVVVKLTSNRGSEPATPSSNISVVISPKDEVSVGVGNSTYLYAMVEGVPDATISWSSSDTNIAKVNSGTVIGVKIGTAIITATYTRDGKDYKDTKEIKVIEGNSTIKLTDVSFPNGELYMPINSSYPLSLILTPSNALISNKEFESSNTSVVTVDENGLVKSFKTGTATITVKINNSFKKSIDVYVGDYQKSEIIVSPNSISFSGSSLNIKVGSTVKLNYSISPTNVNYSSLIWESSDPNIVSVDSNGNVKGISVGTAVVSLTSLNGKRDDITINVTSDIIEVTDIIVQNDSISMKTGETFTITPTISPSDSTNKVLGFISSNSEVATVSINSDGTSAVVSALKAGSTIITITSGKVEKKVLVSVTGEDVQPESNLPTTIVVRSDRNNLAKTYNEVKDIGVYSNTNVNITLRAGVAKIKYCINLYGASPCTPNIDMYSNGTIPIPIGGIYVLRIKKYDYNDNEIISSSVNYVDGVLNYYINTNSSESIKLKQYEVKGAYFNTVYSQAYPLNVGENVEIRVIDPSRRLQVCYTTNVGCTPTIDVKSSAKFTLNKAGFWHIYINEYDANNNKLGNTEVYYAYVKGDNNSNNGNDIVNNNVNTNVDETNYQNPSSSKLDVVASNLKIESAILVGKYLAVDVETTNEINSTRFCYKVTSKGSNDFCNLDILSKNVLVHNGNHYFHPTEAIKTYSAIFVKTKKKTLWFDIDGLDQLYDSSDTNKDVLFSFSVGANINDNMVYSNPIRVRINMTKRTGNDSYWSSKFVK